MYAVITVLIIAVISFDIFFWVFLNSLPETLITVNKAPQAVVSYEVPLLIRVAGFAVSLLPISALVYALMNMRKLFGYYKLGVIFSSEHTVLFRRVAKGFFVYGYIVCGI